MLPEIAVDKSADLPVMDGCGQVVCESGCACVCVECGGDEEFLPQGVFLGEYTVVGEYFQVPDLDLVISLLHIWSVLSLLDLPAVVLQSPGDASLYQSVHFLISACVMRIARLFFSISWTRTKAQPFCTAYTVVTSVPSSLWSAGRSRVSPITDLREVPSRTGSPSSCRSSR